MRGDWKWMMAAAIAALSLALNIWLGASLYRAFRDLQFARVFPVGIPSASVDVAAPSRDSRPSLAIYGDSRALLWDTKPLDRRFRVINLAQGAQTSAQLLLQLETRPRIASDWALVEIGINDLHPLGVLREQRQAIVAGLDKNLGAIVEQLLARSECIVLATIVPPGRVPVLRSFVWDQATLDAIAAANRGIASLHNSARVFVLDGAGLLRDTAGFVPDGYVSEGSFLHINDRAYDRMNRELLGILVNTPGGDSPDAVANAARNAVSRVGSSCRFRAKG